MARKSDEERLPTRWIEVLAREQGAEVSVAREHSGDVRAILRGGWVAGATELAWEATWTGSLDTDYCTTGLVRCVVPGNGLPTLTATDSAGSAMTSGTEADLLFAVVGAARAWWRRSRTQQVEAAKHGDAAAGASSKLELVDPEGVLTPELITALEHWPESHHDRSPRHPPNFRLSFGPSGGALVLATESHWGAAAAGHQLRVAELVARRLCAW